MAGKALILAVAACVLHGPALCGAGTVRGVQGAVGADGDRRPMLAAAWASAVAVELSLIDVLSAAALGAQGLGADPDLDLQGIERALEPLYRVLPKNGHGRLGHSTVRYALHRYFVARGGMHVQGLDTNGEHWNVSSPVKILETEVPGFAQHLLEQRLPNGFDLREMAVLAATLEHLIHVEDLHRLRAVYERAGLDPKQGVREALTEQMLVTHMVLLPMALNASVIRNISTAALGRLLSTERSKDIQALTKAAFVARERKGAAAAAASGSEQNVSFAEAAQVLKGLWDGYGRWENEECKAMQRSLLEMEDKGSGHVKLSDFYDGAKSGPGHFAFTESREYLRTLGAPAAPPEKIVEVVSSLSSETVKAPRALSERLVRRLHGIARDGRVPLHGRLFAQFMHHAFPRECPSPVKAGEASQMPAREWSEGAGRESSELDVNRSVSDLRWLESQPGARETAGWEDLPWSHEEELLGHHHEKSLFGEIWELLRGLLVVAALAATAVHLNDLYGAVSGASPWRLVGLPKKQKV